MFHQWSIGIGYLVWKHTHAAKLEQNKWTSLDFSSRLIFLLIVKLICIQANGKSTDLYRAVVTWQELLLTASSHAKATAIPVATHFVALSLSVDSCTHHTLVWFFITTTYLPFLNHLNLKPKKESPRGFLSLPTKRARKSVEWKQASVPLTQALDESVAEDESVDSNQMDMPSWLQVTEDDMQQMREKVAICTLSPFTSHVHQTRTRACH